MTNDDGIICTQIREQIDIIDIQLGRQVDAQVRNQVIDQVWGEVYQINAQVRILIENQINDK
jgi:hypothetical protein